jgi:hypothetical protein
LSRGKQRANKVPPKRPDTVLLSIDEFFFLAPATGTAYFSPGPQPGAKIPGEAPL